jgi:hypothetical protein
MVDAGGPFMVKFDSMSTAMAEGQKAAQGLTEKAEEQVRQVAGIFGNAWGDQGAEQHWQNAQYQRKQTGFHADARNAEARAFGNVHDIAQGTLSSVMNVLNQI